MYTMSKINKNRQLQHYNERNLLSMFLSYFDKDSQITYITKQSYQYKKKTSLNCYT